MVKQASLQSNVAPRFEEPKFARSYFDIHHPIARSPDENQVEEKVDEQLSTPTCFCLKFEELKCFEAVNRQFERWGVIFNNCIAIQPSNPAFPPHSGLVVLMGSPKNGFLEATFLRPVYSVNAFVTSSQRLVLSAYDSASQLLTKTVLPGANLANSDSTVSPNTLLSVTANNIHRITFSAFDAQFTVDDFSFCF